MKWCDRPKDDWTAHGRPHASLRKQEYGYPAPEPCGREKRTSTSNMRSSVDRLHLQGHSFETHTLPWTGNKYMIIKKKGCHMWAVYRYRHTEEIRSYAIGVFGTDMTSASITSHEGMGHRSLSSRRIQAPLAGDCTSKKHKFCRDFTDLCGKSHLTSLT